MVLTQACYCTREDAKRALDINETARNNAQVDRAIDAASRSIEGLLHRVFYNTDATKYFDWPNWQYAYPWRLWLNQNELAATATAVTSGGVTIPVNQIFFEPVNYGPPYSSIELDRSTSNSFGHGSTPQREIAITGTFGYWSRTVPAGTITASISSTSVTSVSISNANLVGVGDVLTIDSERMLVTDRSMVDTTVAFTGPTTASAADNVIAVASGTAFAVGEVLLLDSERMLIVDIASNNLVVKRAWDGTVLASHTTGTIYASRSLTVTRGFGGTTAATHSSSTAISVADIPGLVRQLAVAEAVVSLTQESGAYAATQGSSDNAASGFGAALPDLRERAVRTYGRKSRSRAI